MGSVRVVVSLIFVSERLISSKVENKKYNRKTKNLSEKYLIKIKVAPVSSKKSNLNLENRSKS